MNHSVRNNRSVNRLFSAMTGTILKRNNDDTIRLIGTATSWILEDTSTGKIIDETTDFNQKDEWIRDYKLNKNVGQFWHKEDIKSSRKVIKSARDFDDVELQILFDNIVGGQDEGFFDWYSDNYGDIPWDDMKSIPKDRIAEYVNENPDVLSEMEDEINISYQDYSTGNTLDKNINDYLNSSRKPVKSSFEHLEEYVTSDSFAESGAFEDYIMDKLVERGFSNDEIEFGWNDPEVKNAREEIDRNLDMDDYVKWCENHISSDKYKYMWYQDWLRANNYPSDYDKALSERYSFDPAKNTYPGPGVR